MVGLRRRQKPPVEILNPSFTSWAFLPLRLVPVILLWAILPAGIFAVYTLATYTERVPTTPDITLPLMGHSTEIHSTDGTRVGGLLKGRRPRISAQDIPAHVKFSFLATEDDAFFEHEGFDIIAIARAFLKNRAAGRVVEGGSTITQQLAKRYLTTEKKYERKIVELLLARRIEATYSKDQILEAYLNEIYLGAGAHGIQAAAEIYFNKTPQELNWGEATLIAGITNSPSRLSPYRFPKRALKRRNTILKRLQATGAITPEHAARIQTQPLSLRTEWDGDENTIPYAAVEVRQEVKHLFGTDALHHGGLDVTISVHPALQNTARIAVDRGLRKVDKRQGYRGALTHIDDPKLHVRFFQASAEVYNIPPTPAAWTPLPKRLYAALVTQVSEHGIHARIADRTFKLPLDTMRWAYPYDRYSKRNSNDTLKDPRDAFQVGDIITLSATYPAPPQDEHEDGAPPPVQDTAKAYRDPPTAQWALDQTPYVEGLLLSQDLDLGYIRAMVGGWDFDRSEFNRTTRGCRQPGSVFKPIVYSRALEKGLSPATVLSDTPVKIHKRGGEVWKPKNADRKFSGFLLLRDALARSRNLPSVEVFNRVGPRDAAKQAYRLGITTKMAETEALSLGASCVKPIDLIRAYSTFARRGRRIEPRLVLNVRRRDGAILNDYGHFGDLSSSTLARLDRIIRHAHKPPPRILDPIYGYQMQYLLRSVAIAGTATRASRLGVPVAGKTGTTNAYDTWFIGFTQSLLTTVWVGSDDNVRPIGSRETGGKTSLPIWFEYMQAAIQDRPQGRILVKPPEEIEITRIDRELGLRSKEGEPGLDLPLIRGTAPREEAPDRKEKAALRVDRESSTF